MFCADVSWLKVTTGLKAVFDVKQTKSEEQCVHFISRSRGKRIDAVKYGPMFCLSKTSNGKDWMIHLVLKQVEELSTSKVALVVTLHNAFGPWEVFKIQKCFQVYLSSRSLDLEETFCSSQELEGFFPPAGSGITEVVGRVSLEMEPLLNEIAVIEKRVRAWTENKFFQKWKADCCIKIGEMKYHCHKEMLVAQSTVIGRLEKLETEKGTNTMYMLDWSDYMDSESIQVFLNYVYYSTIRHVEDPTVSFHMLQIADMYQMEGLEESCAEIMTLCKSSSFVPEVTLTIYSYLQKLGKHEKILHFISNLITSDFKKYENALKEKTQECPNIMLDVWQIAFKK